MSLRHKNTLVQEVIREEYLKDQTPWFIGYSGGKDSSCMLKLVYTAISKLNEFHKKIIVIYCDTGVENPVVTDYVYETFQKLKIETESLNLPFEFKILTPKLDDRFFVKVIGRGYPTPTNIFRWCTDKLRINPVKSLIDNEKNATILLGIRNGESEQRDRTISKHKKTEEYYLNQTGTNNSIFSPIINHALEEVWLTINDLELPNSVDYEKIRDIYSDGESECPVYREVKGQSCGNSRFGCWTCTVVRNDKSMKNLIVNGYSEMEPLFEFRNWIAEFRDDLSYRCAFRRNGTNGPGPITLEGRRIILKRLIETQEKVSFQLITDLEIARIKELWEKDLRNNKYNDNALQQHLSRIKTSA